MKVLYTFLFSCLAAGTLSAQLVIRPGAQLFVSGNTLIALENTDLIADGDFIPGNGTVRFTGSNNSVIGGIQPVSFYNLEINKFLNISVEADNFITINNQLIFTSGLLDVKTYDIDLATPALLIGENENSQAIGSSGHINHMTTLNAPISANPGNMGAIITSTQNLGDLFIRRGFQSQTNSNNLGSSILRNYDISPVNNASLNATLRFHYFDGELNGLAENNLVTWRSENGTDWSNAGFTSRNTTLNYVEKTGIAAFSRWTLSSVGNALPVHFLLFNVKCNEDAVRINWKTAQEQNSLRFDIEKSIDGIHWSVIGNLQAAGNSSTEKNYVFNDRNSIQNSFYRIAQYDIGGTVYYSGTNRSSCSTSDDLIVWPNPFSNNIYIRINTTNNSQVLIKIFDSKGSLIKVEKTSISSGSNQLNINLNNLAKGTYIVTTEWNNGSIKKQVRIIKQ